MLLRQLYHVKIWKNDMFCNAFIDVNTRFSFTTLQWERFTLVFASFCQGFIQNVLLYQSKMLRELFRVWKKLFNNPISTLCFNKKKFWHLVESPLGIVQRKMRKYWTIYRTLQPGVLPYNLTGSFVSSTTCDQSPLDWETPTIQNFRL